MRLMSLKSTEKAQYTPTKWKRILANRRAHTLHRWLIQVLGNVCAWCGATWADSHLEIDHPDGRERANHSAHTRKMRWPDRVRQYVREFYRGVRLQVLCKECNSKDGRARQLALQEARETCPF
jgi:hypothetical protein